TGIASVILALIGSRQATEEEGVREEEFRVLVDAGSEVGELQVSERRLIHNVFEFGDTTVGRGMTPAEKVFALPYDLPRGKVLETVIDRGFARVRIYKPKKGGRPQKGQAQPIEVVGILHAKELIGQARGTTEVAPLSELLHPPLFVPRTTKCDRLFREFQ